MTRPTKRLTRFTLVNPHDALEFDAPDDEIADAVCLLLGGGWYSWSVGDRSGALVGAIGDEVAQQEVVDHLGTVIEGRRRELIAALRSVEIDPDGRAAAQADPEQWNTEHLSSFADVRENAMATALQFEQQAAE